MSLKIFIHIIIIRTFRNSIIFLVSSQIFSFTLKLTFLLTNIKISLFSPHHDLRLDIYMLIFFEILAIHRITILLNFISKLKICFLHFNFLFFPEIRLFWHLMSDHHTASMRNVVDTICSELKMSLSRLFFQII